MRKFKFGLMASGLVFAAPGFAAQAKHHFSMTGNYVEGCSCSAPCACELTGVQMGCEGIGAFNLTGGSFDGKSLAGVRAAYATAPGSWVMIYVDAPNDAKRKTAEAFMRAAFKDWGKIEAVKSGKISISHKGNRDMCSVDGGSVMSYESQAVMGGDGKTPLCYSNIKDPMHPVIMQAKIVHCTYSDGGHKISLKDTNAYFNHAIRSSGKL